MGLRTTVLLLVLLAGTLVSSKAGIPASIPLRTAGVGASAIDPVIDSHNATLDGLWLLNETTYIGSDMYETFTSVVSDSKGNIYAAGSVEGSSMDNRFYKDSDWYGGGIDGLIVKFNSSLGVVWTRYLGGNQTDIVQDLAIDSHDNLIVVGTTSSIDFPTVSAADNTLGNGTVIRDPVPVTDIFITNISSTVYTYRSTYFGGSGYEEVYRVGIDGDGDLLIAGETTSSDLVATTLLGYRQLEDAFVAKLSWTSLEPICVHTNSDL